MKFEPKTKNTVQALMWCIENPLEELTFKEKKEKLYLRYNPKSDEFETKNIKKGTGTWSEDDHILLVRTIFLSSWVDFIYPKNTSSGV